ncbi:phosphate ABC transporter permease PstA [Pseudomonas syringae pv. aptata]|jgi:phosphate transport system permease protein|uniref:Phosphate transport system permease protein PstA n=8 Tax=Pseudomonas syringae group TaxID=136849 RepID=A0AAQ1L6B0_PSESX|nr:MULTISPECIES: phosphate ABC transporter permease PstA [Pseudomonas]KEZ75017.1 phosphate ABC transporter permease [Pseudomonas syringae pv. syringae FF5]AKF51001.1 phosphate ABC transporter membrane protein 2, PhoT family [Pseudomonas syringae pv. syringae HS191]ALU61139.1 phosphate ABC transporter permease [Pseudomonas syringae pv. lapsa]AVX22545.1 phosphate ABC transporter permease PtsA [Pseudomonas syringae pv. atrofaciens]AZG86261.1 phosphate ABC transporter permease PstA [Pseudomonas sy
MSKDVTGSEHLYRVRSFKNKIAMVLSCGATAFGLLWLVWILLTTIIKGIDALNLQLFTGMTPPPGTEGGLANAFYGSVLMSGIGLLIGTPIGLMAGIWLAEFARYTKLGNTVRFINDILLSAPSIVLGLFVYTVVVLPLNAVTGHQVGFSAIAGALALALLVIPVVVRTTDEMMQLQPSTMREAALALGVPQWKLTLQIVLRAAKAGVVTGVLLALARITGETAPLLFTAFGNQFWSSDLLKPIASVPVVVFQYAMSPFDDWHSLAWAGALVMTLFVLILSLLSRLILLRNRAS